MRFLSAKKPILPFSPLFIGKYSGTNVLHCGSHSGNILRECVCTRYNYDRICRQCVWLDLFVSLVADNDSRSISSMLSVWQDFCTLFLRLYALRALQGSVPGGIFHYFLSKVTPLNSATRSFPKNTSFVPLIIEFSWTWSCKLPNMFLYERILRMSS